MKKNLILFIVLFISCKTSNVVGTFSSRSSPYRFIFRSDSTFRYHYHEGVLYSYSFGHWSKVGKGKIKLESFYKDRTLPLLGTENISSKDSKTVELKIQIPIPDEEKKYYRCLIYINQRLFLEKACDSVSSIIAPSPIKSVQIKITTDVRIPARDNDTLVSSEYHTESLYPKSINLNCRYNDSLFNYRVFNGTVLNFANGKLKFMKYKLVRNLKYKP